MKRFAQKRRTARIEAENRRAVSPKATAAASAAAAVCGVRGGTEPIVWKVWAHPSARATASPVNEATRQ